MGTPAFAEQGDSPPLLQFYAINAGYKDDNSSQNFDFIELRRLIDSDLDLSPYRIVYTNSSNKLAGEITFADNLLLSAEQLVLGASASPQYSVADGSYYVYNYGSSGMASTAGKLELFQGETLIDQICWGKIECSANFTKFATKQEDNYSLVRCDVDCFEGKSYAAQKYYPELRLDSITEIVSEPAIPEPSCDGVVISEIFSYYAEDVAEQFVELYNPTAEPIILDSCIVRYKTTTYPLGGEISPGAYYSFQNPNLSLTKNPTTQNEISIEDLNGRKITSASYPHGQKKGTSYALFDIGTDNPFWRQTFFSTPGEANIYQEFQSCPVGKVINTATGNCINEQQTTVTTCPTGKYLNPLTGRCKNIETTSSLTPCKDGYERNPETNRCRKIATTASTELSPCKDGYERNPETNRCRKVRENTGDEAAYAPTPTEQGETYYNPKIFIAVTAIVVAVLAGFAYVLYQYRLEIRKAFKAVSSRFHKV